MIPRLPFAYPDALKEKEREEYASLRQFIQNVAVPEMQIKLRQGFGRAIRTETDTCVISILDERASHGRRYYAAMREALPGHAHHEQPAGCNEVPAGAEAGKLF